VRHRLHFGKWADWTTWLCRCKELGLEAGITVKKRLTDKMLPNTKACAFCHTQRPRKGFGGERPRKPADGREEKAAGEGA
jgi:hypothetical protein